MGFSTFGVIICDLCNTEEKTLIQLGKRPRYMLVYPNGTKVKLDLCSKCSPADITEGWKNCLIKIIKFSWLKKTKKVENNDRKVIPWRNP